MLGEGAKGGSPYPLPQTPTPNPIRGEGAPAGHRAGDFFRGSSLNFDDAVVLETFPNRIEAEMAAGLLESEGIEARIMADDAGGAYPMLQFIRGVKLMVAPEDEARAKEILAAMEQAGDEVSEP
jgi:hypothetical protein